MLEVLVGFILVPAAIILTFLSVQLLVLIGCSVLYWLVLLVNWWRG